MLLIYISLFMGALILSKDMYVAGYKVLLNPFFWTVLISIFYLVIPSIFVEDFNFFYDWGIAPSSIFNSHVLIFIYMFLLSILLLVFPANKIKIKDSLQPSGDLLKLIWVVLVLYLFYVFAALYFSGFFLNAFHYDGVQNDPFKIKNISYLLLFISSYLFWQSKNYLIFLPNIIIAVLDLVAGSRTTALIVIIPILVSICVHHRKLYILPALLVLIGMSILGVLRTDMTFTEIPWYISALGEFRETYLTLPLYIENEEYVGKVGFINAVAGLSLGVLQPLRGCIMENITFAGIYLADDIDRGYGLGSNLLIEGLYHGYIGLFITLILFFLMLFICYKLILKIQVYYAIFFISLLIIIIRLVIREGFYTSVGLMLLIVTFYWLPFYLSLRIRIFPSEFKSEKIT